MATSKVMILPVILSRPEKIEVGLTIFSAGSAVITSSPGCGAVVAGGDVPRSARWPGGVPGGGAPRTAPGTASVPGGGKGCDSIAPGAGAAARDSVAEGAGYGGEGRRPRARAGGRGGR